MDCRHLAFVTGTLLLGMLLAVNAAGHPLLPSVSRMSSDSRPRSGIFDSDGQSRRTKVLRASLARWKLTERKSQNDDGGASSSQRVFYVTNYGADPTGSNDSTDSIMAAIHDAFNVQNKEFLITGVHDLGGAEIRLEGGNYRISGPLRLPANAGNLVIHGGTLRASDGFPTDRHLIELWSPDDAKLETENLTKAALYQTLEASGHAYSYEFVAMRDLMLDCNFRGGAIAVINSLRTSIDNCYISHFKSTGVFVQGGHETLVANSFLGQHITAGGDPSEKQFTGTAIALQGNDNALTDVVIFSAAVGVLVSGQANILTGVHCYNKATGWDGVGIKLNLPGLTQTRIVGCYLDYTGIVAEDPVQLEIVDSFFLGDAFIKLKSGSRKIVSGVSITGNMFSGSSKGTDIVQLQGSFNSVDQTVIDRNNVRGMNVKVTTAMATTEGSGSSFSVDFGNVLLFPDLIRHVQYSFFTADDVFPRHILRNVSDNRVIIGTDLNVSSATVSVLVDQCSSFVQGSRLFS